MSVERPRPPRSRIRLLHVANTVTWIGGNVAPSILEELVTQARSFGECTLHEAQADVRSAGIEVDTRLIEALGEPAGETVVAQARSWPAHLIVCGTHGRRGLKRLLLGSDAEYIVQHTPVPVLLIRGRES